MLPALLISIFAAACASDASILRGDPSKAETAFRHERTSLNDQDLDRILQSDGPLEHLASLKRGLESSGFLVERSSSPEPAIPGVEPFVSESHTSGIASAGQSRNLQVTDSSADYFLYNVDPTLAGIGASLDQDTAVLAYGLNGVGSVTTSMYDLTKAGVDEDWDSGTRLPVGTGILTSTSNSSVAFASAQEVVVFTLDKVASAWYQQVRLGPHELTLLDAISSIDLATLADLMTSTANETGVWGRPGPYQVPRAFFNSPTSWSVVSVALSKEALAVGIRVAGFTAASSPSNASIPGGGYVVTFRRQAGSGCASTQGMCVASVVAGGRAWLRSSFLYGTSLPPSPLPSPPLASSPLIPFHLPPPAPVFNGRVTTDYAHGLHLDSRDLPSFMRSEMDIAWGQDAVPLDGMPVPTFMEVMAVGYPENNTVTVYMNRGTALSLLASAAVTQQTTRAAFGMASFLSALASDDIFTAITQSRSFVNPIDGSFVPMSASDIANVSLSDRHCFGGCVWPPEWIAVSRIAVGATTDASAYAAASPAVVPGLKASGGTSCGWSLRLRNPYLVVGCPGMGAFSNTNASGVPQYLGLGRTSGGAVLVYDLPFLSSKVTASRAVGTLPHGGGVDAPKFARTPSVDADAYAQVATAPSSVSLSRWMSYSLICRVASDFSSSGLGSSLGMDLSSFNDTLIIFAGAPQANRVLVILANAPSRQCSKDVYVTGFRTTTELDIGTSVSYSSEMGYIGSPTAGNTMLVSSAQDGRLYVKAYCFPNRYIQWPFASASQLVRNCLTCPSGRYYKGGDGILTSQQSSAACNVCPSVSVSLPRYVSGSGCVYRCQTGTFGPACEPASIYVNRSFTAGGPYVIPAGSYPITSASAMPVGTGSSSLSATVQIVQTLPPRATWVDNTQVYFGVVTGSIRMPVWRCFDGYSMNASAAFIVSGSDGLACGFGIKPGMSDATACLPPPPPDPVVAVDALGAAPGEIQVYLSPAQSTYVGWSSFGASLFVPPVGVSNAPVTSLKAYIRYNFTNEASGATEPRVDTVTISLTSVVACSSCSITPVTDLTILGNLQTAVSNALGVPVALLLEDGSWYNGRNLTAVVIRVGDLRAATTYRIAVAAQNLGGLGQMSPYSAETVLTLPPFSPTEASISSLRWVGAASSHPVRTLQLDWTRPTDLGGTEIIAVDVCIMMTANNTNVARGEARTRLQAVVANTASELFSTSADWPPDVLSYDAVNFTSTVLRQWYSNAPRLPASSFAACDIVVRRGASAVGAVKQVYGPSAAPSLKAKAAGGMSWYLRTGLQDDATFESVSASYDPSVLQRVDIGCGLGCLQTYDDTAVQFNALLQGTFNDLVLNGSVATSAGAVFHPVSGAAAAVEGNGSLLLVHPAMLQQFKDWAHGRIATPLSLSGWMNMNVTSSISIAGVPANTGLVAAVRVTTLGGASGFSGVASSFNGLVGPVPPTAVTGIPYVAFTTVASAFPDVNVSTIVDGQTCNATSLYTSTLQIGVDCAATGSSWISVAWGHPQDAGGAAASYLVEVATDAAFTSIVARVSSSSPSLLAYGVPATKEGLEWYYPPGIIASTAAMIGAVNRSVLQHATPSIKVFNLLARTQYYARVTPFNIAGYGPASTTAWPAAVCTTGAASPPGNPSLRWPEGMNISTDAFGVVTLPSKGDNFFSIGPPTDAGGASQLGYTMSVSYAYPAGLGSLFVEGLDDSGDNATMFNDTVLTSISGRSTYFLGDFLAPVGTTSPGELPTFAFRRLLAGAVVCVQLQVNASGATSSPDVVTAPDAATIASLSSSTAPTCAQPFASLQDAIHSPYGYIDCINGSTSISPALTSLQWPSAGCFRLGPASPPAAPTNVEVSTAAVVLPLQDCVPQVAPQLVCAEDYGADATSCFWAFKYNASAASSFPSWLHPRFNAFSAALMDLGSNGALANRYAGLTVAHLNALLNGQGSACPFSPAPLTSPLPASQVTLCNSTSSCISSSTAGFVGCMDGTSAQNYACTSDNHHASPATFISSRESTAAASPSMVVLAWTIPSYNGGAAITDYQIEESTDGGVTFHAAEYLLLAVPGGPNASHLALTLPSGDRIQPVRLSLSAIVFSPNVTMDYEVESTTVLTSSEATVLARSPSKFASVPVDIAGADPAAFSLLYPPYAYTNPQTASALVTGLQSSALYVFRVTAVNSAGKSAVSVKSPIHSTGSPSLSSEPFGLQVTVLSAAQVRVCWSAPVETGGGKSSALGYTVYAVELHQPLWCSNPSHPAIGLSDISTSTGNANLTARMMDSLLWFDVARTANGQTCANVTTLQSQTTYSFAVTAVSLAGEGPASVPTEAVTTASPSQPAPPLTSSIDVSPASPGSVYVSWAASRDDGGSPIGGYRVYVAEVPFPAEVDPTSDRTSSCDARAWAAHSKASTSSWADLWMGNLSWFAAADVYVDALGVPSVSDVSNRSVMCTNMSITVARIAGTTTMSYSTTISNLKASTVYAFRIATWSTSGGLGAASTLDCTALVYTVLAADAYSNLTGDVMSSVPLVPSPAYAFLSGFNRLLSSQPQPSELLTCPIVATMGGAPASAVVNLEAASTATTIATPTAYTTAWRPTTWPADLSLFNATHEDDLPLTATTASFACSNSGMWLRWAVPSTLGGLPVRQWLVYIMDSTSGQAVTMLQYPVTLPAGNMDAQALPASIVEYGTVHNNGSYFSSALLSPAAVVRVKRSGQTDTLISPSAGLVNMAAANIVDGSVQVFVPGLTSGVTYTARVYSQNAAGQSRGAGSPAFTVNASSHNIQAPDKLYLASRAAVAARAIAVGDQLPFISSESNDAAVSDTSVILAWRMPMSGTGMVTGIALSIWSSVSCLNLSCAKFLPLQNVTRLPSTSLLSAVSVDTQPNGLYSRYSLVTDAAPCGDGQLCSVHVGSLLPSTHYTASVSVCGVNNCSGWSPTASFTTTAAAVNISMNGWPVFDWASTLSMDGVKSYFGFMNTSAVSISRTIAGDVPRLTWGVNVSCRNDSTCLASLSAQVGGFCAAFVTRSSVNGSAAVGFWARNVLGNTLYSMAWDAQYLRCVSSLSTEAQRSNTTILASGVVPISLFVGSCNGNDCMLSNSLSLSPLPSTTSIGVIFAPMYRNTSIGSVASTPIRNGEYVVFPVSGAIQRNWRNETRVPSAPIPQVRYISSTTISVTAQLDVRASGLPPLAYVMQIAPLVRVSPCSPPLSSTSLRAPSRLGAVCNQSQLACVADGYGFDGDGDLRITSDSQAGVAYDIDLTAMQSFVVQVSQPTGVYCKSNSTEYPICLANGLTNFSAFEFMFTDLAASNWYTVRYAAFDGYASSAQVVNASGVFMGFQWNSTTLNYSVGTLLSPFALHATARTAAITELNSGWTKAITSMLPSAMSSPVLAGLRPFTSWSLPLRTNQPIPPQAPDLPTTTVWCNRSVARDGVTEINGTASPCASLTSSSLDLKWPALQVSGAGGVPLLYFTLHVISGVIPPIALKKVPASVRLTGNAIPFAWTAHAGLVGVVSDHNLNDFVGILPSAATTGKALPFEYKTIAAPYAVRATADPSVLLSGLMASTGYILSLSATNAAGESSPSEASLRFVTAPATVPQPPLVPVCLHPAIQIALAAASQAATKGPSDASPSSSLLFAFAMPFDNGGAPLSHVTLNVSSPEGPSHMESILVLGAADVIVAGDIVMSACQHLSVCPLELQQLNRTTISSYGATRMTRYGAVLLRGLAGGTNYSVSVRVANSVGQSHIVTSMGCQTQPARVPAAPVVKPIVNIASPTTNTFDLAFLGSSDEHGQPITSVILDASTDGVMWFNASRAIDLLSSAQRVGLQGVTASLLNRTNLGRGVGVSGVPGVAGRVQATILSSAGDKPVSGYSVSAFNADSDVVYLTSELLDDWYGGAIAVSFGARNVSSLGANLQAAWNETVLSPWRVGWNNCTTIDYRTIQDQLKAKTYPGNVLDATSACARFPSGAIDAAVVETAASLRVRNRVQGVSGDGDMCSIATVSSMLETAAVEWLNAHAIVPIPPLQEDIHRQFLTNEHSACVFMKARVTQLAADTTYAFKVAFQNAVGKSLEATEVYPECFTVEPILPVEPCIPSGSTSCISTFGMLPAPHTADAWLGSTPRVCSTIYGEGRSPPSILVPTKALQPPGPVEAFSVDAVTESTVRVSWLPPVDTGGGMPVCYRLEVAVDGVQAGDVCGNALIFAGFNASNGYMTSLHPAPMLQRNASWLAAFKPSRVPSPLAWRGLSGGQPNVVTQPAISGPPTFTDAAFDAAYPFPLTPSPSLGSITPSQYVAVGGPPPEVAAAVNAASPYAGIQIPFAWAFNATARMAPSQFSAVFQPVACVPAAAPIITSPQSPIHPSLISNRATQRLSYTVSGLPIGAVVRVRVAAVTATLGLAPGAQTWPGLDDSITWRASRNSSAVVHDTTVRSSPFSSLSNASVVRGLAVLTPNQNETYTFIPLASTTVATFSYSAGYNDPAAAPTTLVFLPPGTPPVPAAMTLFTRNQSAVTLGFAMPAPSAVTGCSITRYRVYRRLYLFPLPDRDAWQKQQALLLMGNDTALPAGGYTYPVLAAERDDDAWYPMLTRLNASSQPPLLPVQFATPVTFYPLSVTIGGLRRATIYAYTLSVGCRASWSDESPKLEIPTFPALPGPPGNLRVANLGPVAASLLWNYPLDDGGLAVNFYRVDILSTANGSRVEDASAWVLYGMRTTNSADLSGLQPSTVYYVRVTPSTGAGYGETSTILQFRTSDPLPCPGAADPLHLSGNCSSHGMCHPWAGTCLCETGYASPGCMFMDGYTWKFTVDASINVDANVFAANLMANLIYAANTTGPVQTQLYSGCTNLTACVHSMSDDRFLVLPSSPASRLLDASGDQAGVGAHRSLDAATGTILLQVRFSAAERALRNIQAKVLVDAGTSLSALPPNSRMYLPDTVTATAISNALQALVSTTPKLLAGLAASSAGLIDDGQAIVVPAYTIVTPANCAGLDSCAMCLANSECGWCSITAKCGYATRFGYVADVCPFTSPDGVAAPTDPFAVDVMGSPLSGFFYHSSIASRASCLAPCRLLSSCSDCTHRVDCGWCEDAQQCMLQADLSAGLGCGNDTTGVYKITRDSQCALSRCPLLTSRWTCTLDPYCGFCDAGGWPAVSFCAAGDSFGFIGASARTCSGRYYFRSTSISCPFKSSELPDCQTCVARTGCGWCGSTSQCGYSSLSGSTPALGTCPIASDSYTSPSVVNGTHVVPSSWFSAASSSMFCPAIPRTPREMCASLTECSACLRMSESYGCSYCEPSLVSDPSANRCMMLGDALGLGSAYGYTGSCPSGATRGLVTTYPYFNSTLSGALVNRVGCSVTCDASTPLSASGGTLQFGSVGDLNSVPQIYRRPSSGSSCTWMICPMELTSNLTAALSFPQVSVLIDGWDLAEGDSLVVTDGNLVRSLASPISSLSRTSKTGQSLQFTVSSSCVRVELTMAYNTLGGSGFRMTWSGVRPSSTDLMMILMIVIVSVVVGGFLLLFVGVKLGRRFLRRNRPNPFAMDDEQDPETLQQQALRAQRSGRGAPDFVLRSFPVFVFDRGLMKQTPMLGVETEDLKASVSCPICLLDLEDGDETRVLLCRHAYHRECIDQWLGLNKHCPTCRRDVAAQYAERSSLLEVGAPDPLHFGTDIKIIKPPPLSEQDLQMQDQFRMMRNPLQSRRTQVRRVARNGNRQPRVRSARVRAMPDLPQEMDDGTLMDSTHSNPLYERSLRGAVRPRQVAGTVASPTSGSRVQVAPNRARASFSALAVASSSVSLGPARLLQSQPPNSTVPIEEGEEGAEIEMTSFVNPMGVRAPSQRRPVPITVDSTSTASDGHGSDDEDDDETREADDADDEEEVSGEEEEEEDEEEAEEDVSDDEGGSEERGEDTADEHYNAFVQRSQPRNQGRSFLQSAVVLSHDELAAMGEDGMAAYLAQFSSEEETEEGAHSYNYTRARALRDVDTARLIASRRSTVASSSVHVNPLSSHLEETKEEGRDAFLHTNPLHASARARGPSQL